MNWRQIYSRLGVEYTAGPAKIATCFGITEYGVFNRLTGRVTINTKARPHNGTVTDTALHELGHWTMTFQDRDLSTAKEELFACEFAAAFSIQMNIGNPIMHASMAVHYEDALRGYKTAHITKKAYQTARLLAEELKGTR